MGLDTFNVAEDNKGGRKPKDETEDRHGRDSHSDNAYTSQVTEQEYWSEVYNRNVEGDEPTKEELMDMSREAVLLPRTVKQKLTECNVHEYDDFTDKYMDIPSSTDTEVEEGSLDIESNESGLASLVNNAK